MFGRSSGALPAAGARALVGFFALALSLAACAETGGDCTEIGCESEAIVTFDATISEVYTLIIDYSSDVATARCNDPGSLLSQENPEWLNCNGAGFSYTGVAADEGDLIVTIFLDDSEQTPVCSNELVSMGVTEEGIIEPNGPDCLPICFERFGSLLLPSLP